ncbi:hypothetical protein GCM10009727_86710 [Actinomadura napierensis]|uniref:AB hydrolase-1 domain-containing protein n=1 Tax=Actinomadura napierensis TaxID=267854 RepID=A0ABN3AGI0_9ACTN
MAHRHPHPPAPDPRAGFPRGRLPRNRSPDLTPRCPIPACTPGRPRDLADWLDALFEDAGSVHLVGRSLGAAAALQAALQLAVKRRDRVAGLTLVAPFSLQPRAGFAAQMPLQGFAGLTALRGAVSGPARRDPHADRCCGWAGRARSPLPSPRTRCGGSPARTLAVLTQEPGRCEAETVKDQPVGRRWAVSACHNR